MWLGIYQTRWLNPRRTEENSGTGKRLHAETVLLALQMTSTGTTSSSGTPKTCSRARRTTRRSSGHCDFTGSCSSGCCTWTCSASGNLQRMSRTLAQCSSAHPSRVHADWLPPGLQIRGLHNPYIIVHCHRDQTSSGLRCSRLMSIVWEGQSQRSAKIEKGEGVEEWLILCSKGEVARQQERHDCCLIVHDHAAKSPVDAMVGRWLKEVTED